MPAYQGTSHEVRFTQARHSISLLVLSQLCVHAFNWLFRRYDTKTTSRAVKLRVVLVNLLHLVLPNPQIPRYSAHNPSKINRQLSEAEPRIQLDLARLVHHPQTKAQQHPPQQARLEAGYLVSNRNRNNRNNLSNQLSVDLETLRSNHSSRVEVYLEAHSVTMRLISRLVSRRLVNNLTVLCVIAR